MTVGKLFAKKLKFHHGLLTRSFFRSRREIGGDLFDIVIHTWRTRRSPSFYDVAPVPLNIKKTTRCNGVSVIDMNFSSASNIMENSNFVFITVWGG